MTDRRRLLIDGYNLLHQTDLMGRVGGPTWLAASRTRLLSALCRHLSIALRQQTTVIFDAKDAPEDLPAEHSYNGIRVVFARDHEEADDLLEEIIERDQAAGQLWLISSDRRIQKAAHRRRANVSDANTWFRQLMQGEFEDSDCRTLVEGDVINKPTTPIASTEVQRWLEIFDPTVSSVAMHDATESLTLDKKRASDETTGGKKRKAKLPNTPAAPRRSAKRPPKAKPDSAAKKRANRKLPKNHDNPFPMGYAEDVDE